MSDSINQFPSRDVPESQKDQEYHNNWAKAIHHLWKNDKTSISNSNRGWISLMRMYGAGEQPKSLYVDTPNANDKSIGSAKSDIDGDWNGGAKQDRGGENSLNYSIMSIMPRIKNKMKGALANYSYDISVNAIDKDSSSRKEERKWQVWAMKEHGAFIRQLRENAGIPHQEEAYLPKDTYELNLFEAVQGFKLGCEKAMQKLFKHTFEISNWKDIEEDIVDDIMDCRWGIAKVYLDEEDNKFKAKYIDPYDVIVPYDKHDDYTNMPFAGHYDLMTISDIRIRLPHLTEEDIYSLADSVCGRYGNSSDLESDSWKKPSKDGSYSYDSYKVEVLHCEWIDWTSNRKMYYNSSHGRLSAYVLDDGENVDPKPGKKEIKETITRKLRKCSFILGSNHSYEWGYANLTDRPQANKVVPNYIVVKLKGKALTEVLYPVMDDVQLAYIKFQDGRQMAIDAGYAIDFSMLQNISDGERQYNLMEILKMWRDYKILLYQGSLSGRYEGGAVKPIFDIPGTAGQLLQDAVIGWDLALRKVMDLTGISPVALGASPAPGESATGTMLSEKAMNDIIQPIVNKMLNIKERVAGSLIRRLQLALRVRDDIVKAYEPVIGDDDVEVLKQAEKTHAQYGFILRAKPTEEEKQALIRMAEVSLNNRREGKPGIDSATYAYVIEQVINGGDLKEMRMVIAFQEKKARDEMSQQQQKAIESQNKGLQELEAMKAQTEQRTSSMKAMVEIGINREKAMGEILKNYYAERPEEAREFLSRTGLLSGETPDVNTAPQVNEEDVSGGTVPINEQVA
jgi:hypothetical protein